MSFGGCRRVSCSPLVMIKKNYNPTHKAATAALLIHFFSHIPSFGSEVLLRVHTCQLPVERLPLAMT